MTDTIEAAKSSRAACRLCGEKIKKGELRFGEEYESEYGYSFRWYHLPCAAKKLPALVRKTLEDFDGEIPDREALDAILAGGAGDGAAGTKEILPDFPDVSIAPTGRAMCIQCGEAIAKGTQRIAVEIDMELNGRQTRGAGYMHPACVGAWLGDNEDVDAAAFNRIVVAKGGELAKVEARPVVELPPIAGKSPKQLQAIAKKIIKLRDRYRIGDYLEEQVEWKHKDEVLLHLLDHGALDAGRNVYVAVYLEQMIDDGEFEGEELARLLRVTERVLAALPSKLNYAEHPLLPELPDAVFQLAGFLCTHAPERARALYQSAKPNVQAGLALAMALARTELPEGSAELLTEALGALIGDYPPTVYGPSYGPNGELELDVDALAAQLGTTSILEKHGLALLKKRSPEIQTLHGLGAAFGKATPKQVMRGIDAFLCYASKPDEWGPLRKALATREDLVKLAKLAAKIDESSGERARLLLFGLLDKLPKGIEDSLWFSDLTSYDGAFLAEYESVMNTLGQKRARALGERALVQETPIEARKGWVPLLVRVYGEPALPLLHGAIERGYTRCLHLAPEHALAAIDAVGGKLEDGVTPRVRTAVALAAAGKPVPETLDALIAERPRTISEFVGALPDARLSAIVETAMKANPPETVIGQVRKASEAVRAAAIGTFVSRRKKIKKTTDARYELRSFPDAAKLLEQHLAGVEPGEKKFFRMLEKALSKDDYARVCATVGRKVETPLEKLQRLMAGEGNKRTTLFFPAKDEFASLRVETLSYVGKTAPPGVAAPKGQEDDATHILSLDLSPFPDLVAEFGAETLSLFVEAPNSGEFNDDATLVASAKLEAIPKGGQPLDVGALQLPEALRRSGKSEEARDLRSILYARDGHAFGPAYWIQRSLGPSVTLQLNDVYLNLGDAGSLYVGDFGTTWQCH